MVLSSIYFDFKKPYCSCVLEMLKQDINLEVSYPKVYDKYKMFNKKYETLHEVQETDLLYIISSVNTF